jgi:exosortase
VSTTASPLGYAGRDERGPAYGGISPTGWLAIGIVTLLMIATFRFNLIRLWGKTNPFSGEGEWGHAIIVPIIGLYFLYINRDELLKAEVRPLLLGSFTAGRWIGVGALAVTALLMYFVGPAVVESQAAVLRTGGYLFAGLAVLVLGLNWGLAMLVFGLVFFAYGIWPGQNDYFKDLGMVCTVFGVVLTLCGWQVMKVAWFPIAFLICALPWPGLFYSLVAGPLQVLAAQVAVGVLQVVGIDAFQSGTKIHMGARVLNVAEACAGLKSLMTFVTVAAAVAFLSQRPLWQRLFMVAAAIPIAIFCNVVRVAGQGLLDQFAGPEWSENFAHQFVGLVMLVPAFFLILLLGWVLDRLFVEEADEEALRAVTVASGKSGPVSMAAVRVAPEPKSQAVPVAAVKSASADAIEKVRSGVEAVERPAAGSATTSTLVTVGNSGGNAARAAGKKVYVGPGRGVPGGGAGQSGNGEVKP